MNAQNATTLTEYGDLIEEPFTILESYFKGQHLERLVRHQIESFNHFSNYQILRTIQMFNPVIIHSENDFVIENEQYMLEIFVSFENLKLYPPQIHENNGATKMMLPQEAKLRNFTYSSTMTVDLNIQYVIRNTEKMDTPKIINKVLPKINIGKLPIMLKSSICVLTQNKHISSELLKECPMDCGGYFIIKGSEKTVLGQERAAENRIYCFDGKNTPKWNWFAEIKSVPDFKCISPKQIEMMISSKNNGFGNAIYISIPRIKQPIELFVLFRALGVANDKQICQYIVLDIENEKYTEVLNFLQASIIDANKYTTMEDAIRHITSYVAYTPMNMDREMGNRKKREFALDVLNNDLFPHCKTLSQKLYLLGYMANKLIQTSFGWKTPDDRDSYLNKRIDLTGTLLNNLFRNYFNKLVKEMQKQVIREINNGSWRSSEDYENIINMTNIYKIIKSTTIENGITRALATGDFSIKQANSSKVGVAQVLSRLTYPSSLSHLRRINTPLEKSGELIAPRKLHNTTFGYLCLTGDVEVLLADKINTKQIKNIKNGDCVNTVNIDTLHEEPSFMHSYFSKMPDKLFEITTMSGRKIKATADHPFLVNEEGIHIWKSLENLTLNDKLIIRHMIKKYPVENTTFIKLNECDIVANYKNELLEIGLLNVNIPIFKLQIIARLIGALITIGELKQIENTYKVSFLLEEECDVLQIIQDIEKLGFGNVLIKKKNECNKKWKIYKSGVFAYFLSLFCECSSNIISLVPQWILQTELSIKQEFLSAFQGGSGLKLSDINNITCYIDYNNLSIAYKYLNQIVGLFHEFGIKCNILSNENIQNLYICFDNDLQNLLKYADTIHYTYCESKRQNSAFIIEELKIKQFFGFTENALAFVVKPLKTGLRRRSKEDFGFYATDAIELIENGCVCVSIFEINEIEPEMVYDFTTFSENHSFVASSFVVSNCCVESPEGASIGVVKNISYMAHITIPVNSGSLYEYVEPYILKVENATSTELCDKIKVFINGAWVGTTNEPLVLYNEMKNKKYQGIVNIYTSIVFDFKMGEIRICSDGGRLTRPLLRVEKNNKLLINRDIIYQIENGELGWNDLLISGKLENSVLEYIDPEEQNYSMIYMKNKNAKDNTHLNYNYTHCEIHPSTIFGILASCSPFPEHNQAPRNTYQTAMIKQAIGIYAMNYDQRMDKSAYILTYPSKPLVDTRLINFIHLNRVPSGCQIHVAIMTNTGYNQEDSILINKGSIDRGLFTATIYHTERDEDKNIIRDEIIRCKPDPSKTKGIKFGNYGKLNAKGFIPENSLVENRDIIIAKIIPIKENRNDMTKIIKFEDQSKSFRTTEETYIDKNFTGRNGDGYNFAKVRVRTFRKPVLGDKFACALPTQQVLTHAGWVEFQHLDILKHKVCTLDTNGNMCYENPIQKFEYDHDGFLYFVSNKQVRIICTLNHNLYVKNNTENFQLFQAQEIMRKPVQFQKSLNNVYPVVDYITLTTTENYPMDAWIQLLALFMNDKSISCFKNKILLNKLKVNYFYNKNNNEFQIYENNHPELFKYFNNLEKRFPKFVWNLSKRQSILLLENIVLYKNTYHTISTNLANDIARLATHCGWSATIQFIKSFENYYTIYIEKIHNQPFINKPEQENDPEIGITNEGIVAYCGKVYCIEMPSSNLYYFRENMYSPPMLSGNSRSAQKGTVGNIIPEEDMPFTKDGLRPDIILNPHAIPSRMTIGQLKETLLGKVLLELGLFGDGTSFGDLDVATIANELLKCGYESYGNEIMYNGMSGEQFETSIFFGPVFYQRLKHMVNDKQHSRAIGPMVNLTHQPAEGRSRDGGFRIGEMERDVLISHGMTKFTRERLFDVSDKYSVYICKKCGMIACYNDGDKNRMYVNNDFSIHLCKTCGNKTDFALVEMPYANKLLFQELQTINVVPRVITE